jgi:MFS transporter, DHA1 family, multidrug resistance protein
MAICEANTVNEEFNWKRNLIVLWCCVFLVCASYTMVIPFLPLFLLKELQLPVGLAKMWSGGIIAITFVVAGVMAPFWGARGDVIGQKKNALRAGIGLGLCYFLSGVVVTPGQLLGVRLLTGIISGFVPACMTMASSSLPEEKTGWGMGLMQTANFSGSIMGPLLGGLLSSWFGMRTSFFVAAVSLLVATAAIYFMVSEPKQVITQSSPTSVKFKDLFNDLRHELSNRLLLYIMGIFAIVKACTMVIQPLLTIYVSELLNDAPEAVGISGVILSLAGIAGIIAAPFWGNQGQAYGYAKMLSLAMIFAGITNMFQLAVHNIWLFALVYFIYGLFLAGAAPNLLSYVVQSTESNERGKAFGLTTSADQLGGAIGPLAGGFLGAYLSIGQILALTGCILIIAGSHIYIHKVKMLRQ